MTFDKIFFLAKEKIFLLNKNGKFGFANIDGEITIEAELDLYLNYCGFDNKDKEIYQIGSLNPQDIFKDKEILIVKGLEGHGLINNRGKYLLLPRYRAIVNNHDEDFDKNYDNIFRILEDKEFIIVIYNNEKIGIATFDDPPTWSNIKRINKHLIEFNFRFLGRPMDRNGLINNNGEILLNSKNPLTYKIKRNKIIKEYG